MRYEIQMNGFGYTDHVIREDGTLVTNSGAKPHLITNIRVVSDEDRPSNAQCFALFVLIMQLHKELNKPIVSGDLTWEEIVAGAK